MLTETLGPAEIELELNLEDVGGRLSSEAELHLYRIAQEFVSNVVKHSGANRVNCKLATDKNYLSLVISDNGSGIAKDAVPGLGMLNMKERAAIIGAQLEITTSTLLGCVLTLEVLI